MVKVFQPFAAVVWDVDGTLLDSEPLYTQAINRTLTRRGRPALNIREITGHSADQVWERVQGQIPISYGAWMAELAEDMRDRKKQVGLRPGIAEILQQLSARKIPMACASNAEGSTLRAMLDAAKILDRFETVVSRTDVPHGKPEPDVYLEACQQLGIAPEQALAIEDTEVGVHAAHAAGLTVIAFPNANSRHQNFALAHHKIAEAGRILEILEGGRGL